MCSQLEFLTEANISEYSISFVKNIQTILNSDVSFHIHLQFTVKVSAVSMLRIQLLS
jgi:hypothetical protein